MKKLLVLLSVIGAAFVPMQLTAQAGNTVSLTWSPTPSAAFFTNVVYIVYTAQQPFQTYSQATTVAATNATITVPSISKIYVTAALKDAVTGAISNESAPSNTVVGGNLTPPTNLSIKQVGGQ